MAETTKAVTPDTIKVEVERIEELSAESANLFVIIKGSSLFTGGAALSKAKEVAQLIADLKACGLTDEDIHLEGIYAEVASGMLSRSSRATYKLKIHCAQLEDLVDVLGAITSQKNTTLQYIQWGYPKDSQLREHWLKECIEQANHKAQLIAAGLSVQLLGVFNFREWYADSEEPRKPINPFTEAERGAEVTEMLEMLRPVEDFTARKRMVTAGLGTEVSHTKKLMLRIAVEYHISEFTNQGEV